ncbi:MAG: sulfurtransferase TusA family protein [Clostridia bacterium]|nr:sulfurtransferase TusA family protein [Clostridia bacterium]MBQ7754789.1 sulfurtransferase TusA family protein [Clostridia bacterium]
MVDARGYSCPIPVVMVQRAVKAENPQNLTVLVDEQVCVENVTRFAKASGYSVTVTRDGDDFKLELTK